MKAGILTFHGANNYGAVLQAYALSEWLKQHRIESEIIDYRSKIFDKYRLFRTQLYKKSPYLFGVDLIKCVGKRKRNNHFASFRNQYLPVSSERYCSEAELDGITERYDYFICGSDQIWNPELSKRIDPVYFLNFVADPNKKIAYAPSVAVSKLTEFQIEKMTRYMASFASLSIREQEAIDLLQPYCEKEIAKVCDPVFLPDRGCYDLICSDKYTGKKFVFLYVVGSAAKFKDVISFAEKKAKENGLGLYYLIDGDKTFTHIQGKNVFGCRPSDFLSLIKNAQYVISNSFHATAFSILFEKQFATFLKEGTGSRMVNLLRDFKLEDRVFDIQNRGESLNSIIDYNQFDKKLEQFRSSSEEYLLCSLGLKARLRCDADEEILAKRREAQKELRDFVEWRRKCFLARHKDAEIVAKSRSGGVFTAMSDAILSNGGVVYGCRMDGVGTAIHQRATSREERDLFRGSKYIQSEMRDCFKQAREDLRNGLPVLFSGTPCQIAGLYGFLRGENTSNLYTVDIICHGVPSRRIWNEYLSWMKRKHGGEISSVNFRDKRYGWKAHLETVKIGNVTYPTATYRMLFYRNTFLRPSCYECPFSSLKRASDITIGDAWGIEQSHSPMNDDKGCSIVLINSENGKKLMDNCRADLITENADLEDYLQPNLHNPSAKPEKRQQYWTYLDNYGFDTLAKRYGKPGPFRRFMDWKLIVRTNGQRGGKG